jgi:RecA-family ATPase
MEIDKHYTIIREFELPVACLVHSSKKRLHAIVKVDVAAMMSTANVWTISTQYSRRMVSS